jgi:hypothetical protein
MWERVLVGVIGLILCLAAGASYAPAYFGSITDTLSIIVVVAAVGGWIAYRWLWPLAIILAGAVVLCGVALLIGFRVFLGLLNVAGAAWRGELSASKKQREAAIEAAWREALSDPNLDRWAQTRSLSQEEQWQEEDRRYEEHRRRLIEAARPDIPT